MSLDADLERGHRASALLNNPAFTDAFADIERAIHDAWAAAPIRDLEGQQVLKLQLKLLSDLKANLEQRIADGNMAAVEIDRRRRPSLVDFRR